MITLRWILGLQVVKIDCVQYWVLMSAVFKFRILLTEGSMSVFIVIVISFTLALFSATVLIRM
jgi:hypothetical protein